MKRLLVVLTACFMASCGGSHSATEPSCANISGAWNVAFTNSCGLATNGSVGVIQQGCDFSFQVPGTTTSGTLSGNTGSFTFNTSTSSGCAGNGSGSLSVIGSVVTGTFTGTITASGPGCCPRGAFSGAFTLTR